MVAKIALEEHFLDPNTVEYWWPTMVDVAKQKADQLYGCLIDFGDQRLQMMDKVGIARAVLAIAGPGVQAERDAAKAVRAARASNDFLAKEVQKRPGRYSGFAHLAMQDRRPPPMNWSAACATSSFAARWSMAIPTGHISTTGHTIRSGSVQQR